MDKSRQILSDIIVFMKYSRFLSKEKRREIWDEIVDRNKKMMLKKYPKLKEEIEEVYEVFVRPKKVLPSMRSLQFGGKAIEKNNSRLYNCSVLAMSHVDSFKELAFLLMSGCGVGYSVQLHHIDQLPEILKPKKERKFLIADSIEGWADAVGALIESHYGIRKSLPRFDFSDIREKGKPLKTSGGTAPGPEPLQDCLHHVQQIFNRKKDGEKLTSLEVHDICCHIADCVVVGGTRRSSCIALFTFDDTLMLECKFGEWYKDNPQRGRANNSAVILRHKIKEDEFMKFFEKVRASGSGEPGWVWSNNDAMICNPCGEIALKVQLDGTGSMCNLTEIDVSNITTQLDFNARARAASFLATLQAGFTDFHFLRDTWKESVDHEALIGVGLTGIASGHVLDLNLREAAENVVDENIRVAQLIDINPAYRTTTVKPSGTASLVLGCSSGIHAWHSEYYIRRLRIGKDEVLYKYLAKNHPELLEDDYFKPSTQAVISVPIKAPDGATTRKETALQLLNRVKRVYNGWVKPGHIKGDNTNNISCTVTIKEHEWERIGKWFWENRNNYTAISVLPYSEHTYKQAPFEEIDKETYEKMIKSLKKVDLTKVSEIEDNTSLQGELACSGNSCEVI